MFSNTEEIMAVKLDLSITTGANNSLFSILYSLESHIDWKDKAILITGGTGSFGKKLIETLLVGK